MPRFFDRRNVCVVAVLALMACVAPGGLATVAQAHAVKPVTIKPVTLKAASFGTPYSETLRASGGLPPYTFALHESSLPPGLNLSASGAISGVPTEVGTYTFTVEVGDSSEPQATATITYTLTVALTVTPKALGKGTVGTFFERTLGAIGGDGEYVFSLLSGTPPPGIELDPAGLLSGTPTSAGTRMFTVGVEEPSTGRTAERTYKLSIALRLVPASLPEGAVGTPYSATVAAEGGSGEYSYTVSNGELPHGLALDAATGEISGTPTTPEKTRFTLTAQDASTGSTGSMHYEIVTTGARLRFPEGPFILEESPGGHLHLDLVITVANGSEISGEVLDEGVPEAPGQFDYEANTGQISIRLAERENGEFAGTCDEATERCEGTEGGFGDHWFLHR